MSKVYEEQKINVDFLELDFNNPRFIDSFDDNLLENEVVEHLLHKENAIEIVKEIYKEKDFYADSLLWVLKKDDKYIVKEGNRRLAAVKALSKPSEYLKNSKTKYEQFIIKELPCLVYNDETALEDRIIRKHTQMEIASWSRLAQGAYVKRYVDSGRNVKDLNIKNHNSLLKLYNFFEESKRLGQAKVLRKMLEEGKAAIIERFFSSAKITEQLGFYFDEKNNIKVPEESIFINTVKTFSSWLSSDKDITAHKINKKSIQGYINDYFAENGYKKKQLDLMKPNISGQPANESEMIEMNEDITPVEGKVDLPVEIGSHGKSKPRTKEQPHSLDRKALFPSDFRLNITTTRINNIYLEMKDLSEKKHKESFAIMTRIFLELSVDDYGDKNVQGYKVKREDKNVNFELLSRTTAVIEHLKNGNVIDIEQANAINTILNNPKSPLKIMTLNQYVHNKIIHADESALKTFWDNARYLFEGVWS